MSLKPQHLKRYKDILSLLARYGLGRERATAAGPAAPGPPAEPTPTAAALADELEALGPTFVKLGQLLSTRSDVLAPPYLAALARLQDRVEPFPFAQAEEIVSTELGVRMSKAFRAFDERPLAAASLGQVHRAELRDGRVVAVKVQRPDVRERILVDLEALDEVAGALDAHTEAGRRYRVADVVDEFRRALLRELDYRNEAESLRRMGRDLVDFPRILVPQPVADYSGARVLTMDLVRGRKVTALTPLARTELDGAALADELFRAYLEQILVSGFFHSDPHPGNVFLTGDGRLALLDLGQTAQLSPRTRETLLRLLLALGDARGEDAAETALPLADRLPDHDARSFVQEVAALVSRSQQLRPEERVIGREVLEVVRIGAERGVRMPRDLIMLGKALLDLDEVGRTLDPAFDPSAAVRRHAASVMERRMRQELSPGHVLGKLLEVSALADRLPADLNRALDALSQRGLEVSVRSADADRFLQGAQQIANRITVGLVIASLVLGAAMLMRVETAFTLFGYPGLAMLLFLGAALAGLWVIWDVVRRDVRLRGGG